MNREMKQITAAGALGLALLALLVMACQPPSEPGPVGMDVGILDATATPISGEVIWIGSAATPAAVYFSADEGETFTLIWYAPGDVYALDIFGGYLYASADNAIYRSPGNVNFSHVFTATGASAIYTLEVCGDALWAGADDGKIYSTTDGTTWTEFYDTGEDAVYDIEIWDGTEELWDFGIVGAIATGDNGKMFVVRDCEVAGSDDTDNTALISAAASALLVPGGDTPGGGDPWSVYTGGTEFAYAIHSFNQFTATNWLTASVESGIVLEQFMRIAYSYTPTPAPEGDGTIIQDYGPYGLKNGDVEYYRVLQGVVPSGGTPTPTPAYANPTVVSSGYDRVNELLMYESGGVIYYMVAGGDDGGGFFVDWSETFTDTGEFLSVIVGEVEEAATATPQVYYFSEILGSQGPTPTRTPTPTS